MRLENVPITRLCSAVAVLLLPLLGASAHAGSVTDQVTGAFETIVIDASKAASKATAAAKEALSDDERKPKRRKKDAAKTDGAKETGDEKTTGEPSTEKKKTGNKDTEPTGKAADKSGKTDGDETPSSKATSGKDVPAEPATKAAGEADPKSGKKDDTASKKPAIPTEWPAVEVELAKARCTQLLKGVDAVTIPEAPFRKGDCGTMAPVRLVSIGKTPEISFSPPPVITCDMVVALTKWMKEEVQPAARKHLGSEVIRVESMSDYSCRMAYGRIGNKLSEHGKANALDIGRFVTRKGDQAVVLTDWGLNKRDLAKQIAAAKAAAEKAAAAKVAAEDAATERAETAELTAKSGTNGTSLPRKTLVEGVPSKKESLAVPAAVTKQGPATSATNRKKDGRKGKEDKQKPDTVAALPPADGAAEAVAPPPKTAESRFLHEVHASACRIFGTTLGPEANEAHRNHFHVDMAERKYKKICD